MLFPLKLNHGLLIQVLIMPGADFPAEVLAHAGLYQFAPGSWFVVKGERAADGRVQGLRGGLVENKTGGIALFKCGTGCVDDGVDQSAGAADHRHGAVAQAVELIQAAWLEA